MTIPSLSFVEVDYEAGEKFAHARRKGFSPGSDKEREVGIHESPRIDGDSAGLAKRDDSADEIFPVLFCPKDSCLREAPANDMVERTGGIKAGMAGHN
jgi:hypothetical protein